MSVIRTFFDTDLFSEFCNDTHIWFRNGWNDIKKVYSQINMITNSFEGEIQAIVNIDDEMCGHYVDMLMHGNIMGILELTRILQWFDKSRQIAINHVIDKYLDNSYLFNEKIGKRKNLSEMDYVINAILNDIFNDVLDILNLHWIVHKFKDIKPNHTEYIKNLTSAKAIHDRSRCLRTTKDVLDKFLKEDLLDETMKNLSQAYNLLFQMAG
ncbi:unnamed protein product [Rhizophagus irregularis]|nr:unnamed protein product [Rhizophagus irregularis]